MFPRIYSEAWQAKNIGVLEGFFSGAATTLNDRPKSASTEVFSGGQQSAATVRRPDTLALRLPS